MEYFRAPCRVWYHKEATGVVEGKLSTYWMHMGYEERMLWESKAAEFKVSVDEHNTTIQLAEVVKL